MDLEYFAQVLGRVSASSLLTAIFFGILWILVYSSEKVVLIMIVGYIALGWFLLAFASCFLVLMCGIWSDIF